MFARTLAKLSDSTSAWTRFEKLYADLLALIAHTIELILHFRLFSDYKLPVGLGVGLGGGVLIAAIIVILIVLVKRKEYHRFVKKTVLCSKTL